MEKEYTFVHVLYHSTLYLAPAIYPVIFGFMLRDVRSFFNKLIGRTDETTTAQYSPSMATRVTQASRTVTPLGTPELPNGRRTGVIDTSRSEQALITNPFHPEVTNDTSGMVRNGTTG